MLPIAGVLLSILLYGHASGGSLRVGIVNYDGSRPITQDTIRFIEGLSSVKVTMTDEQSLRHSIAAGELDSGLVFGPGFAASVREGKPQHLTIVSIKGEQATAYVKSMLDNYIGNVASIAHGTQGDPEAFDSVYADYRSHSFKLTAETLKDTSNQKNVTYQSFGFLIAFMMFSAASMTGLILKEKENRTFLRLLSSPVTARNYVLANVTFNFLVLALQVAVTLVFLRYVCGVDSGIPFGAALAALLLFALAAVALSLLIVAFAKSSAAANAMQNLIITPTCLLAGCYFPVAIMPDSVRKIANFLPQHWLLDMVDQMQNGRSFGSQILHLGVLIAFTVAFALIAIYRFGRNNETSQFV
jgi:ABC-2 type transport system permease protein